jgi:hypothetical protein
LVALATLPSCTEEACLPPPCPLPIAIIITVTARADGAPVSGVFVRVSGAVVSTIPCNAGPGTTCYVPGYSGTYHLEVGAPGFVSVQETRVVGGTIPECGCPTISTERLAVALVAGR